ncbi:MAG: PIN domain-containing protein [Chloroflexi bacterium]|nr:PIN domain-containing protein [Chloroflexota bacterium]
METTSLYVIDTHPLVWYLEDSPKLSPLARHAFDEIEHGNALGIVPTIVLAEIIHLSDRKRIPIGIEETIASLQQAASFGIVSLDLAVILLMTSLKTYELHDRVIVATAISFGASLVTKDEHIRKSSAVVCVW